MSKWTDRRIEDLLARAVEQATPDVYEAAASAEPAEYEPILFGPSVKKKNIRRSAVLAMAACLVLLVWSWLSADTVAEVHVNPAVELTLNIWGRVIGTRGLNEDGWALLQGLDLKYEDAKDAADELAGAIQEGGWLPEKGAIAILVRGRDYARAEKRGRALVAELAMETGLPVSLKWRNDTSGWPSPEPGPETPPAAPAGAPLSPTVFPEPAPASAVSAAEWEGDGKDWNHDDEEIDDD